MNSTEVGSNISHRFPSTSSGINDILGILAPPLHKMLQSGSYIAVADKKYFNHCIFPPEMPHFALFYALF